MEEQNNKEARFQTSAEKFASLIADSLIECNRRFRICRGLLSPEQELTLSNNQQVVIQVDGLLDLINSQKELITNGRAAISHLSENDHKKLIELLRALRYFEKLYINASQNKLPADDFMQSIDSHGCYPHVNRLTENFYDMMEELEESFESISMILLKNGLLTPLKETQQVGRSKLNQL